jgi:23S rRNA (adenine2503-C2)-methyltransferase
MELIEIVESREDFLAKKYVFEKNGKIIENSYIGRNNKNIICVSCMFGCPVGCKFCASGDNYFGNLNNDEMSSMIFSIIENESLDTEKKLLVSFMGSGEPSLNIDEIIKTIKSISEKFPEAYFAISFSGVKPENLLALKELEGKRIKLQLSLHSPIDSERKKLIPLTENINEIFEILSNLNFDLEVNYILLNNINDSSEHALRLSELVKKNNLYLKINDYHNVGKGIFESINKKKFIEKLKEEEISFENYSTDGVEIGASCGQLKAMEIKSK